MMEFATVISWIGINWLIGYLIGQKKNAIGQCVALSIFLGPIGWLAAALVGGSVPKRPFCAENVKPEAVVCPHCQRDLPKIEAPKPALQPPPLPFPHPVDHDETAKSARHVAIAGGVVIIIIIAVLIIVGASDRSKAGRERSDGFKPPSEMDRRMEFSPRPAREFVRLTKDFTLVNAKGKEVKSCQLESDCG